MLLYRPRFRYPERAARPPNLSEAESMPPGINPIFADAMDLSVDVETPTGEVLEVDDPNLRACSRSGWKMGMFLPCCDPSAL